MTTHIQKILVPIDFTPGSADAVPHALSVARAFGAHVTLLHVFQIPAIGLPDGTIIGGWPETAARIVSGVEERLETMKGNLAHTGVQLDARSAEGDPADQILQQAKEGHYDLIVVGTHGRTGLSRAVMGSVAEQVVRRSSCPVLTVRRTEPAAS